MSKLRFRPQIPWKKFAKIKAKVMRNILGIFLWLNKSLLTMNWQNTIWRKKMLHFGCPRAAATRCAENLWANEVIDFLKLFLTFLKQFWNIHDNIKSLKMHFSFLNNFFTKFEWIFSWFITFSGALKSIQRRRERKKVDMGKSIFCSKIGLKWKDFE